MNIVDAAAIVRPLAVSSPAFVHVCQIQVRVGTPGGEDGVPVEVELYCHRSGTEIDGRAMRFRYVGFSDRWVPICRDDAYIVAKAEDWIEDHQTELLCAAPVSQAAE